jgi:hypothetical protein
MKELDDRAIQEAAVRDPNHVGGRQALRWRPPPPNEPLQASKYLKSLTRRRPETLACYSQ